VNDEHFRDLYDRQARNLWAYVARMTGCATAADDIVQEAFLRVYTARALEAADADHRRRYLYTVASNLVRRRGREAVVDAPVEDLDLAATGTDPADALAVRQALAGLSIVERQALWLSYAERYSAREIAVMLGYRDGSLRQVMVRARRRFVALFGDDAPGGKGTTDG
jgi:RNA polymerase sigma factor (sigma-70 family)